MDGRDSERSELIGQTLDGRYRIRRRLGIGGTGIVFEALCQQSGAQIAIKTLRPTLVHHLDLGTRLRRELEVSRRVLHPGVVRFLDEGTLPDGSPYLVMPHLRGVSLARLLVTAGELPHDAVVVIASRVASILHSAHVAGYVHRDVKPEHVLLCASETRELRLFLLDFGVCSSAFAPADEKKREAGRVFGTPSYVSPEQASGEVAIDGRADLFALGVVMFEALSGTLPFAAPNVSKLLLRIIRDDAPCLRDLVGDVDAGIALVVEQLLMRQRERRLPSARALSRALLPYAHARRAGEKRLLALLHDSAVASDARETVEHDAPDAARVA